eukprot:5475981-Pyramimonas_sp.AAC.1
MVVAIGQCPGSVLLWFLEASPLSPAVLIAASSKWVSEFDLSLPAVEFEPPGPTAGSFGAQMSSYL